MPGMTDRDAFAAAALTGLLAQGDDGSFSEESYVRGAYRWADAMLRERAKTNHDASPEAIASVESVAPQPTTRGDSDRTDKAAPRPSQGTGDTPATHTTPGDGSVPREGKEPVAWGVAGLGGILATSTSRTDAVDMQSEYEFVTEVIPLYRQAPDFAPPPPDNAAKAPDNAEPVAWAVCTPSDGHWSPCFFHEPHAQRCANAIFGSKNVVALYRKPTLTDAEREAVERAVDSIASTMPYESQQGLADWKTLRGLLRRMGGGR